MFGVRVRCLRARNGRRGRRCSVAARSRPGVAWERRRAVGRRSARDRRSTSVGRGDRRLGPAAGAGVSPAGGAVGSESGGVLGGLGGLGDPMGVLLFGSEPAPSGAVSSSAGSSGERKGTVVGPLTKLDAGGAALVDREAFPARVAQLAGGAPSLPAGDRITRVLSANAAQIALPNGGHAAVESAQPMWVGPPGHRQPVDLGLTKTGSTFESARPLVGVMIPRQAGEGVAVAGSGCLADARRCQR